MSDKSKLYFLRPDALAYNGKLGADTINVAVAEDHHGNRTFIPYSRISPVSEEEPVPAGAVPVDDKKNHDNLYVPFG